MEGTIFPNFFKKREEEKERKKKTKQKLRKNKKTQQKKNKKTKQKLRKNKKNSIKLSKQEKRKKNSLSFFIFITSYCYYMYIYYLIELNGDRPPLNCVEMGGGNQIGLN